MPLYEYVCEEEGKPPVVIELLRPAADADKPVQDPEGKGRTFKRRLSSFASKSIAPIQNYCPCGKRPGSCGSANG